MPLIGISVDLDYDTRGPWDYGKAGVDTFTEKHKCSRICAKLKLQPFQSVKPAATKRKRTKTIYDSDDEKIEAAEERRAKRPHLGTSVIILQHRILFTTALRQYFKSCFIPKFRIAFK
jgi:hypothetical protein